MGINAKECLENAEKEGICINVEVKEALLKGKAVVALESTIVCHGMPFPQNLETAQEVESIIRKNGAVPATIAICDGIPYVGMSPEQLERIAKLGKSAIKTARRDIAAVVSRGQTGATTVSATMFFASKAGIRVFVTGGIGGVHRNGETSMDISSDLTELGRTAVTVVCAGAKSVLDIPRTLEYLETQGVTVVGYGTNEFPAFFSPTSGCQVPWRADSPESCAALIEANSRLSLQSGIIVSVPIPCEFLKSAEKVQLAIHSSLEEAQINKVGGNEVTPFLLRRINELSGGASLLANIALVKNNAKVGALISVALEKYLMSKL